MPYPNRRRRVTSVFRNATPYATPFARTVDRGLPARFALLRITHHIQVVYTEGLTGKAALYFNKGRGILLYITDSWTLLLRTIGRSTGTKSPSSMRPEYPFLLLSRSRKALRSFNYIYIQSTSKVSTRRNKVYALDQTATAIIAVQH